MNVVTYDIAVADSGNTRVLGAPWNRWKFEGGSEVLFRYMPDASVHQYLKDRCGLTDDEQRMFLAVHEVGHTFAMHAVGMAYGAISVPESPESLDGRTDLQRFARSEWREPPRTAHEAVLLTLGGWVATETWLEVTSIDGRKLRDDPLNVCHAQVSAADDHYDLMCFPTPRPTAYLYGAVEPPAGWQGDVIVIEDVRMELITMFMSRWPHVIKLAELVAQEGGATEETIARTLGEPGWAG